MTAISSNLPAAKPAGRMLFLLAAVFVLPFLIGTGLFWSGWRPGKFSNYGELLQPARDLPAEGLKHADGTPFPNTELLGKWLLVLPVNGVCEAICLKNLQQMQQVHIALNKDQNRLQRVLISSGTVAPVALQTRFPDLVLGVVAPADAAPWQHTLEGSGKTLYIIDPLGKVMMRYAEPGQMRGVLKDLERLLKYSWIR